MSVAIITSLVGGFYLARNAAEGKGDCVWSQDTQYKPEHVYEIYSSPYDEVFWPFKTFYREQVDFDGRLQPIGHKLAEEWIQRILEGISLQDPDCLIDVNFLKSYLPGHAELVREYALIEGLQPVVVVARGRETGEGCWVGVYNLPERF